MSTNWSILSAYSVFLNECFQLIFVTEYVNADVCYTIQLLFINFDKGQNKFKKFLSLFF